MIFSVMFDRPRQGNHGGRISLLPMADFNEETLFVIYFSGVAVGRAAGTQTPASAKLSAPGSIEAVAQ